MCEDVARAPAALRPLLTTTIGLFSATRRAIRAKLRGFLRLPTLEGAVAESDGAIAGFVISYRAPGNIGHVVTLDVTRAQRRSGVGRALMEEVMARLARKNVNGRALASRSNARPSRRGRCTGL